LWAWIRAGMVLIDARHESVDEHLTTEQLAAEDAERRRFQNMLGWMAKLGWCGCCGHPAWPRVLPGSENLPAETRTTIGVLQARPEQIETALAEGRARMDSNARLLTAAPLRDAPLIVLASAQSIDHLLFWKEAQQTMAGLSSNSRLIVAPSGHAVHFEQPALVVESIRLVVDAARTGQPLQP
jgi:pimeloyl-ACP methyl ester carboxylesterase